MPVDCQGNEIYPWFSGCSKYIKCDGTRAEIIDCPTDDASLSQVCGDPTANECGYSSCQDDTSDVIGLTAADNTPSTYYAVCNKGVVLYQSRCRSEDPRLEMVFDETNKKCKTNCKNDEPIVSDDCKTYYQCIDNTLHTFTCPETTLFDGIRCSYGITCNRQK